MDKNKAKLAGLKRRQRRVRGKIFGTPERPRLRVVRTNANIYAMIVDDTKGITKWTIISEIILGCIFAVIVTS